MIDRQTSSWNLKHPRYDLLAFPSVPMAFVDWPKADDGATANASRDSFHCVPKSIHLRVFPTGPKPEVERLVRLLVLAIRCRVVCHPDVVDNIVERLDRDNGTVAKHAINKPTNRRRLGAIVHRSEKIGVGMPSIIAKPNCDVTVIEQLMPGSVSASSSSIKTSDVVNRTISRGVKCSRRSRCWIPQIAG